MTKKGSQPVTYTGFFDDASRPVRGVVPAEAVVPLHVNGAPLVRLMCTPVQLEDLAVGFLFTEGMIETADEVEEVRVAELPDGGPWIDMWMRHDVAVPDLRTITSGCSGGTIFGDATADQEPVASDLRVTPDQVTRLLAELGQSAGLYKRAGGLHTAALADPAGLVCVAEDIGRHNALDKIAGACLRRGKPLASHLLLTTGRISAEMVTKAARMRVPVIVSRTSPTSLSIDLAQRWAITLIGYTRRRSFRVYTGEERVVSSESAAE